MKTSVPEYFKPLLWEYDLSSVDPEKSRRLLVSKAVNYGDLRHWKWISGHYGAEAVRQTLLSLPASAIRPGARALAEVVFRLPHESANAVTPGSSRA